MIFAFKDHINQIINGDKTQTRRSSNRYRFHNTYAVQPCRTCKGISEGRILITGKRLESRDIRISKYDALAEGGYTPEQFEELYEQLHPNWKHRYVYSFMFVKRKNGDQSER